MKLVNEKDRFKFRVWQTELKKPKMKYNSGLIINNNEIIEDGCVVMQCTGLKDKNGKLIYEGDIVNIKYIRPDGFEIRKKCKVEFGYYSFWLYYKCGASLLYKEDCTYEIIGNIYENKELLNEFS